MPLTVGTRLGPYEILAPIGAGGMGEVYKARDTRLDRIVAIKVSAEQFGERFEREARAIAALNHSNICTLYDVGPSYLVMEYIAGTPLLSPAQSAPLPLDVALKYAAQICDALDAAHRKGVTHRDLKPSNILVTKNGVKLLDFGLAKIKQSAQPVSDANATASMALTGKNEIVGTLYYMSPEQLQATGSGQEIDARSDIFSFGLVLYEMLTGKRAFDGPSPASVIAAILERPAPSIASVAPPALDRLLQRCLKKDPDERWQSARDLKAELEWIASPSGSEALPAGFPVRLPEARKGLHWTWLAIGGACLAVGLAIAAFLPVPATEPAHITPFAADFEFQTMPRWLSNGDRIAYVAPVDGTLQVFTKTLGSSTPTKITHEKKSCLFPFWSSDGTRIYFSVGTRPNTDLKSIAVAGGESQVVVPGAYRGDMSPDGKTLALLVSAAPGSYRLAFSSPPGAPPKPYMQAPLSEYRSQQSSFIRYDERGQYLGLSIATPGVAFWKIPVSGGAPVEMLHGSQNITRTSFSWTKNDTEIIGDTAVATIDDQLSILDLKSRTQRNITASPSKSMHPALSPDGQTIAFDSGEYGYDIIEVPLDGSPVRDVIATARTEMAPTWAPDGVHFAYSTNRNGVSELWLRDRNDRTERLIAGSKELPESTGIYDAEISPDGSRVAYRNNPDVLIWISPLTGEPPVRLWADPANSPQRGASWSPDGNWIAYYGVRDGRTSLMKARVGPNSPAEFLAYMGAQYAVRWSPRGDWILFRDGEVLRIISTGGKQNKVVSHQQWETYGWSKDGSVIYGIVADNNRRQILSKIDLASGIETAIRDIGPVPPAFDLAESVNQTTYRGFSLHPDGKSFLTSILRIKTQIYLMRDFDRKMRLIDWVLPQGRVAR